MTPRHHTATLPYKTLLLYSIPREAVSEKSIGDLTVSPFVRFAIGHFSLTSQYALTQHDDTTGEFLKGKDNNYYLYPYALLYKGTGKRTQWTTTLAYDYTFGDHAIDVNVGYEEFDYRLETETRGLGSCNIDLNSYRELAQLPTEKLLGRRIVQTQMRNNAFFCSAAYTFKNRYSIAFAANNYRTSIDDGKQFSYGASAVWHIGAEPFMARFGNLLSEINLRAGYGVIGHTSKAEGEYDSRFGLIPMNYNNIYVPTFAFTMKDEGAETKEYNIGLDWVSKSGRIELNVEYYNRTTTETRLDDSILYPSTQIALNNIFANRGIDLTVTAIPVESNRFRWTSSLALNYNDSEVVTLGFNVFYRQSGLDAYVMQLAEGQPLGQILGYIYTGLDDLGRITHRDMNSQGISGDDQVYIASTQPTYILGWNNTLRYGNFELNILLQGVAGNQIFNTTRWMRRNTNSYLSTAPELLNRWTPENTDTDVEQFRCSHYDSASTLMVEDGAYLRLENLTLGYRLPESLLRRLHTVSALRLYLSANNLFTLTHYSGYDPEACLGVSGLNSGSDYYSLPALRSISFGLDVTF